MILLTESSWFYQLASLKNHAPLNFHFCRINIGAMTDNDPYLMPSPTDADGGHETRSHIESADNYDRVVTRLNARWRVIECAHGIQWILQRRVSTETYATSRWVGRSYCRTSEALRRCSMEHAGQIDPAAATILAALPERFEPVERCRDRGDPRDADVAIDGADQNGSRRQTSDLDGRS